MVKTRKYVKHPILSCWIIMCGLLYVFAYQFILPFRADTFLYGMVVGLIAMAFLDGRVIVSKQVGAFAMVAASSIIGVVYTTMPSEGIREAILFTFFAGVFALSLMNPTLIRSFVKWMYIASVVVMLSSILHFLAPDWFNNLMRQVLQDEPYERMMWSYTVDSTFAGIAAFTPNTTFSAAIVVGNSFLNIAEQKGFPVIKSKLTNCVLLALSAFSIILCSKRGVFIAMILALAVLMFYLYRGSDFLIKFLGLTILTLFALVILYFSNEFAAAFFNRFVSGDFLTGRGSIYSSLITDFAANNWMVGRGTGATYKIAESGAHNIYIQILYDHGLLLSIPYFVFLAYNYYISFRNRCPVSIYVQTVFLVYGLSGNPLYSNMFMIIYVYYVLYAAKCPGMKGSVTRGSGPSA